MTSCIFFGANLEGLQRQLVRHLRSLKGNFSENFFPAVFEKRGTMGPDRYFVVGSLARRLMPGLDWKAEAGSAAATL